MIRVLKEYNIGRKFSQLRSCSVTLEPGKDGLLFVHSENGNLDCWEERFTYPKDTLKLTMTTEEGVILWWKDLGPGVIPGRCFEPVLSFDMDGDGTDEIYLLDNDKPELPFTFEHRILVRLDSRTGEETGRWQWPCDLRYHGMAHAFRFELIGGYAHGEPVLVCAQGIYNDMFLQAYSGDMELRWQLTIWDGQPGARGSHSAPLLDINGDGVDELFWGERVLSIDDGHEICCGDRETYHAHSDIILPYEDNETGEIRVYTCREGQEEDPVDRVVMYDRDMNAIWRCRDGGHMDYGWVAAIGENRHQIAMAVCLPKDLRSSDRHQKPPTSMYFDAKDGTPIPDDFPFTGYLLTPIDFDGDGYHEFFYNRGDRRGDCIDRFGHVIAKMEGSFIHLCKMKDRPCHQVMTAIGARGVIRIYGDDEAKPGPMEKYRTHHEAVQKCTAAAGDSLALSCGI